MNEYTKLQKQLGYTNKQVAELFNVRTRTVERWRAGNNNAPKCVMVIMESLQGGKAVKEILGI